MSEVTPQMTRADRLAGEIRDQVMSGRTPTNRRGRRYCGYCGKDDREVSFTDGDRPRRCDVCAEQAAKEHAHLQRVYSRARYWATKRVVDAHWEEYQEALTEELERRRGPDGSLSVTEEELRRKEREEEQEFAEAS